MYRLVGFQGRAAVALKLFLMASVMVVGGFAISSALAAGSPIIAGAMLVILLFLGFAYFTRGAVPLRFLAPGLVFLVTFVLIPIIYTVAMAGFNFKTGNELGKEQAIAALIENSLTPDAQGTSYDMTLGRDERGRLVALLKNQIDGTVSLATPDGLQSLSEDEYVTDEFGVPVRIGTAAYGFDPLSLNQADALGDDLLTVRWPIGDGSFVSPVLSTMANLLTQDLRFDAAKDELISNSTGNVYGDLGGGNYVNVNDPTDVLYPGWRSINFPENFTSLLTDAELRGPFLRVFSWTILFAFLSVFTTFVVGLALALALDKPMRGRRIYRSILILPYAIPGFLSILIWRGMFNEDYGIVNRILLEFSLVDSSVPWFRDATLARIVVLVVNLWLGFPYMYLISTGALQAIPAELKEAAEVDGATGWQALRNVTLPLLLQILTPLLISSFAFNFNNFNIIYLLTGGGPRDALAGERAGATDILISYAYQTAISNPSDQNFGLASAISLFMFIIVGALSMWSIRRSKALEEF